VLSAAKVLGLAGVVIAGLYWGNSGSLAATTGSLEAGSLGLAMVFVLYAYGGWNDTAFVAAEVRDRQKNIPQALILGIAGITIVYLAVNSAYLIVLGFEGARATGTPASDVLEKAVGSWGSRVISVLVMISALGAINGMILTGSRVYAALGADHRILSWLGSWHVRRSAPVGALIAQALIAVLFVLFVGSEAGRGTIDAALSVVRMSPIPWDKYFGGFETLVAGTAPVFWVFFLLTGVALFVLRLKNPARPRPFSVPLFPLPPLLFCGTCGFMLYSSLTYAGALSLMGIVPVAVGLLLYWLCGSRATQIHQSQ
jgi:amino acid transporter